MICKKLRIEKGRVFAYSPKGFEPTGFEYGQAWIPTNPDAGWDLTIEFVTRYLLNAKANVALLGTYWYADDPVTKTLCTPIVLADMPQAIDNPFTAFFLNPSPLQSVEQALREARDYPFVAVLTALGDLPPLQCGQTLTRSQSRSLTEHTEYLLIGASRIRQS